MIRKPWCWAIFAALLTLSLYSLDRVWSQQNPKTLSIEERMKRDVTYLASAEMEGRRPATKGMVLAQNYVAKQFKEAGLQPFNKDGSYFQPVNVGSTAKLGDKTIVKLRGPDKKEIELTLGQDYQILGNSGSGNVSAPLVFAGYGLSENDLKFDEYQGLDVAGKIVVLISRTPRWADKGKPFTQAHANQDNKFALAEKMKAAGIILINDSAVKGDALRTLAQTAGARATSLPAANVKRSALEPVFQSALKKSLTDIEKDIDKDLKPQSGVLTGWSATIECNVTRMVRECKNVVGIAPGNGPLAGEAVVVGGHLDHLGVSKDGKSIYHGADDNASGSATVIELGRRFAAMKNRQGRTIVFITFTDEESGGRGAAQSINQPYVAAEKIAAMMNFDMVGRLRGDQDNRGGKLEVYGLGTAKGFDQLVERYNEEAGFVLEKLGGPDSSDDASFFRRKIPTIAFGTGLHPQYHKPTDTADLINVPGMRRVADMAEKILSELASDPNHPVYNAKPGGGFGSKPKPGNPRLGFTPDYGSKNGVKVNRVDDKGVGAAAGLKAGDVIVAIAGQPAKTMDDYTRIMTTQKAGQTIEVAVIRDSKNVTLKAELK